tara:strand:+ start:997 stop:3090 length:2094 start_codon:yes stop_codon:yes gene_type:complete
MSVLNRKLFNRGGRVSSRGVGITSGLASPVRGYKIGGNVVDENLVTSAPSSTAGTMSTDLGDRFATNLETLRGLNIVPERKPFSKLAAASPALLTLGAKLLSGGSYRGGLPGALDILGQATEAAAPQFAEAIEAKRQFDATDPEAGLKQMALEMALKEKPTNKIKSSEQVYGTFGTGDNKQTGYGFADVYEDGTRTFTIGGQTYNSFVGETEPEENKPETFFKGETVKIRRKGDTTGETFDASFMTGNKGSLKFKAIGADREFDASEFEIVGDLDYQGNVKVKVGDVIKDATQIWDGEKLVTRVGTDVLQPGAFTIVDQDQKPKEDENYSVTIGGKEYTTLGTQVGKDLFIMDPREDSPTRGQQISIADIENVEGITKVKSKNFLSFEETLALQNAEKEGEEKLKIASDAYEVLTNKADSNAAKIAMYERAGAVIDQATTGSFADQRSGIIRFLETFNVDELSPGPYNAIKDALNANSTVATEFLNAAAQKAFINNAQEYDDRLNQTEVGKLAAADFSVGLSAEGQKLLIDINKGQSEIFVEGGDLARLLAGGPKGIQRALEKYPALTRDMITPFLQEDGSMKLFDVTNIANEYVTNRLTNFGNSEEIKTRIESALNVKPVGDAAFFTNLEDRKTQKGHVFNPGDAFKANQIQFAGYPKDGQFEYDGKTEVGLNNSKPVYVYEYEKGGKQFRVIMQF